MLKVATLVFLVTIAVPGHGKVYTCYAPPGHYSGDVCYADDPVKSDSTEFSVTYTVKGVANNTELCCSILGCIQYNSQNQECDEMGLAGDFCQVFTDCLPYVITQYWGAVEATPAITCYSTGKNGTKFQWTA